MYNKWVGEEKIELANSQELDSIASKFRINEIGNFCFFFLTSKFQNLQIYETPNPLKFSEREGILRKDNQT